MDRSRDVRLRCGRTALGASPEERDTEMLLRSLAERARTATTSLGTGPALSPRASSCVSRSCSGPRRPPGCRAARRRSRSRRVGEALGRIENVTIVPSPPQTAMVHVLVRRPLAPLNNAVLAAAEESGVWPGVDFTATADPSTQRGEVSACVANLDVPVGETAALWRQIVSRTGSARG